MHNNNTVVTLYALKGNQKTPLREYDHSRSGDESSARVTLPFGSEYGIGFKFQDIGRRRLELWIDGTMVTDSVVLDRDTVLERFVDSFRRFKFVEASHQAVADPTNPKNGGILIKLWNEVPKYRPPFVLEKGSFMPHGRIPPGVYTQGGICRSAPTMSFSTQVQCSSSAPSAIRGCGFGDQIPSLVYDPANSLVGATIEGSESNQMFSSTEWNGDLGSPLVFQFKLLGQSAEPVNHCPGCGRQLKRKEVDNFCTHCGTSLR